MPHNWTRRAAHLSLLVGTMLAAHAAAVVAQQPTQAQTNAIRQSCRSDYQSYCSSVPTGGAASLQCLQSHLSQLSSPCQTAVSAASGGAATSPPAAIGQAAAPSSAPPPPMSSREKMAVMRRACGADFRAYCGGVRLGGGEGMRCLAQNESRLSPACQNVLAEAHGAR